MTPRQSNASSETRRDDPDQQRSSKIKNTIRVLAAVDGSESSNCVVDYLAKLAKSRDAIEVFVLNVQPLSESVRLRGYGSFKQEEVRDRLISDLGNPIVHSVERRLRKVGIEANARVEIGEPLKTILRIATAEQCDMIVVGDPRPGPLRQWITRRAGITFGSVAISLVELAAVSVVVAKCSVPSRLDQRRPAMHRAPTLTELIVSRVPPD